MITTCSPTARDVTPGFKHGTVNKKPRSEEKMTALLVFNGTPSSAAAGKALFVAAVPEDDLAQIGAKFFLLDDPLQRRLVQPEIAI
ncbi:hypothetical protein AXG93_1154s1760 [Marchantia polymorpha subsp. ruderalis]|uniref:Uncharacterized protein n=1 Tax=Marchantia polymorpha subsp. ruderalis TaxID=1480154 RepID=A0A176WRI2_MARPO|nr:hypothetical protein AXG93_1154s1760 [Marchantia polymorpha subsp. ruderalis]